MKIPLSIILAILPSVCIAQSVDADSCPPALYIQAGGQSEFPSPNANTTCTKAHLLFLESGAYETIPIQHGDVMCTNYPLIHISIPPDTPAGTGKITWLCEDDEPNPCQLIFIEPASASESATATALAFSQECPQGQTGAASQSGTWASSHSTSSTEEVESQPTAGTKGGSQPPAASTEEVESQPTAGTKGDSQPPAASTDGAATSPAGHFTDETSQGLPAPSTMATLGSDPSSPTSNPAEPQATHDSAGAVPPTSATAGAISPSSAAEHNLPASANACTCPPS